MISAFDLFNCSDVSGNAGAIVGSLRSGQMPCDGAWPDADVDRLDDGSTRASPDRKAWRLNSA
jgi:hypothetical protein